MGHVREVLGRLREAGLTASPKKCRWGGRVVEFLGHKLEEGMISIPNRRVEAIRSFVRPRTKKFLRLFLGLVSFYQRYVDMLAKDTATLSPATARTAPNVVVWTSEMDTAFDNICESVCNAGTLVIPLPQEEFSLITDASGQGMGAVLQVRWEGEWEAVTFYSRQTNGPERRYSASKLEALVVVEAIQHFTLYLYGKRFVVFTDHRPLCSLLTSEHLNRRLKRFSVKLQPWMLQIEYLPGSDNTLADALSHQDWEGSVVETGSETCSSLLSGDVGE